MPWDALPDNLNPYKNPDAWKGTKTEWMKWVKGWKAFGPRSKHWWAKFRELPITLLKVGGGGYWRYEDSGGKTQFSKKYPNTYLSRIQPWIRWAFYINWPFFVHFHVIYRRKDVIGYPESDTDSFNIKKMFSFHFGFARDADIVYWISGFIGGTFE